MRRKVDVFPFHATLDSRGRATVPGKLRRDLGLEKGESIKVLLITEKGGCFSV